MNASTGFRIGTIGGIPIRVHYAFLVFLPFLVYEFGRGLETYARLARVPVEQIGGPPWLWGFGIVVALFASVLVHELAHSMYAARVGGTVKGIMLLPIGGVSQLDAGTSVQAHEAAIALIGPATSLLIGVASHGAYWLAHGRNAQLSFASYCIGYLNLSLGLFNLVPAFPMDGGRILRGVLARRRGIVVATHVAARVGKGFAALLAIAGLASGNVILLLVALFVFVGAQAEQTLVVAKAVLGDLRVREIVAPSSRAVAASETLYDVGEKMIHDRQLAFPVIDDGNVLGILTLDRVEHVPLERRRMTLARDAVEPAPAIDLDEPVMDALQMLGERRVSELPVVHEGQLVGTLSRSEVVRGLRLREFELSQHASDDIRGGGRAVPLHRIARR